MISIFVLYRTDTGYHDNNNDNYYLYYNYYYESILIHCEQEYYLYAIQFTSNIILIFSFLTNYLHFCISCPVPVVMYIMFDIIHTNRFIEFNGRKIIQLYNIKYLLIF